MDRGRGIHVARPSRHEQAADTAGTDGLAGRDDCVHRRSRAGREVEPEEIGVAGLRNASPTRTRTLVLTWMMQHSPVSFARGWIPFDSLYWRQITRAIRLHSNDTAVPRARRGRFAGRLTSVWTGSSVRFSSTSNSPLTSRRSCPGAAQVDLPAEGLGRLNGLRFTGETSFDDFDASDPPGTVVAFRGRGIEILTIAGPINSLVRFVDQIAGLWSSLERDRAFYQPSFHSELPVYIESVVAGALGFNIQTAFTSGKPGVNHRANGILTMVGSPPFDRAQAVQLWSQSRGRDSPPPRPVANESAEIVSFEATDALELLDQRKPLSRGATSSISQRVLVVFGCGPAAGAHRRETARRLAVPAERSTSCSRRSQPSMDSRRTSLESVTHPSLAIFACRIGVSRVSEWARARRLNAS